MNDFGSTKTRTSSNMNTRSRVHVRGRSCLRRSEVVHLSAWNDSRLRREPDAPGFCVPKSECEEVVRLRKFLFVGPGATEIHPRRSAVEEVRLLRNSEGSGLSGKK